MRYLEKVITLAFDDTRCNGCGRCTQVCPHAVFVMEHRRATIADRGACMECGACAKNCEMGAISVRAGVGCAAGVLTGLVRGGPPDCGCSTSPTACG